MKLLNRLKRWRQTWPEGPTTYEDNAQMHHCLNCELDFVGDYCPRCGQKGTVGRITWNNLMGNFMELWDFTQRSAFSTLLQLFYRPGYLISDSLNGRHNRYFQCVKLLLVVGLLVAVVEHLCFSEKEGEKELQQSEFSQGVRDGAKGTAMQQDPMTSQQPSVALEISASDNDLAEAKSSQESGTMASAGSVAEMDPDETLMTDELGESLNQLFQKIDAWTEDNQGWTTLLISSFLILPTRIFFRRAPRNGRHTIPEGFIIQTYLSSPLLVLSFLDNLLPVQPWASCLFYFFAYRQLFGYGSKATAWRIVCVLFIGIFFFFLVAVIGAVLFALSLYIK